MILYLRNKKGFIQNNTGQLRKAEVRLIKGMIKEVKVHTMFGVAFINPNQIKKVIYINE